MDISQKCHDIVKQHDEVNPFSYCSQPSVGETAVNLSGEVGSPAKSLSNPFDATSLHMFIREAFPGSVLLEEHQVCVNICNDSDNHIELQAVYI